MDQPKELPDSLQRRKDGRDVAVWLPSDLVDGVREAHRHRRWPHWEMSDTWRACLTYGLPLVRRRFVKKGAK